MKTTFALVLAALALLPAGCSTTSVNTVENAQSTAQKQMLPDKRVTTDVNLDKTVRVVGVNNTTDVGGFLKIQVELQNTSKKLQLFTYRIEWFDQAGMIVSLPTTSATPRAVEGKATAYITAIAPTPEIKDFRISLLESVK